MPCDPFLLHSRMEPLHDALHVNFPVSHDDSVFWLEKDGTLGAYHPALAGPTLVETTLQTREEFDYVVGEVRERIRQRVQAALRDLPVPSLYSDFPEQARLVYEQGLEPFRAKPEDTYE